jgi:hypothetical protein
MKYLLLIYSPESVWTDETRSACMVESIGLGRELASQDKFIASAPLQFVATAKTVKIIANEAVQTTGPFMETIEHLGGFYILDLPHLDEAIQFACRLPPAKKGTVEIRPLREEPMVSELKPGAIDLVHLDQPAYMLLQYGGGSFRPITSLNGCELLVQLPLSPATTATCASVKPQGRQISDRACDAASEQLNLILIVKALQEDRVTKAAEELAFQTGGAWEVRPLFDLRPIAAKVN